MAGPITDADLDEIARRVALAATRGLDLDRIDARWKVYQEDAPRLLAEVRRLRALINTPQTADFLEAVRIEAAHQHERWPAAHDENKTPEDWFWVLGWLASKAVQQPTKRLHHIITAAALLLNWHRRAIADAPSETATIGHAPCKGERE